MGISFKGLPETTDIRNSTSLEIVKKINRRNIQFYGYDPLGSKLKKIVKNKNLKILGKKIDVNIYDMLGNHIADFQSLQKEIDLSSYKSGMYNFRITYKDKVINKKVIKQ